MNKFITSFLFAALLLAQSAFAEQSMRRCMLLPITDSVGGAMGFKVFENLEEYLKEGAWCYYRSNSEIINILGGYKQNLNQHLQNKEVLKVIAEKTGAGALIKVELRSEMKGVTVRTLVFAENGEDVYFKEETRLNSDDITLISQTVKNWLAVYEKTIPYDGKIIGVLGDQFSIDAGKGSGMSVNSDITILRPIKKRQHPLLKEIIDWETEKIGKAKVFNVAETQSQGKVTEYESKKRHKVGDWVRVDKVANAPLAAPQSSYGYDEVKGFEFGKLGLANLFLTLGKGSMNNTTNESNNREMDGFLYGVDLGVELWATRNWWGGLSLARSMGTYSKSEGSLSADSNSVGNGVTKLKFGYRFLPLGFFYGPQVDVYTGYASYSYGPDRKVADGFVESNFRGIMIGSKGSVPVDKDLRLYINLDLIMFPGYSEDVQVYGDQEGASNFHLEFGGAYTYSPSMTLDAAFTMAQSKATFTGPEREVRFKDSGLKFGAGFNF